MSGLGLEAGEHLKGLLTAPGKHWELLRDTVSPSDWFEPRYKVLSTLSAGHITTTQIQPPAICSLS